jgi:hypothetical protein
MRLYSIGSLVLETDEDIGLGSAITAPFIRCHPDFWRFADDRQRFHRQWMCTWHCVLSACTMLLIQGMQLAHFQCPPITLIYV